MGGTVETVTKHRVSMGITESDRKSKVHLVFYLEHLLIV